MRRLLLLVLAAIGVVWWIRRWWRSLQPPRRQTGPRQPAPDDDLPERMVRDRVCNTFLPRSRAISARIGPNEHFFCSESCRETFLRQDGA